MRKITKSLLTLALLVLAVGSAKATKLYATYGTPASNGGFDGTTGVYTWTAGSNNLMDLFTFAGGELANYKSIHFTTDAYTDIYRICFMNGSTAVATIVFYSAGDKNLIFTERTETKDLDLSQITSIKFGGVSASGSIKITKKPYLEKPMSLTWGDDGTAEIDITDLTASDGFTLNDQTGELVGTGASGVLSVNFPAGGVDLSSLTGFTVTYTGDNLFGGFKVGISESTKKDFYSNPTGRNDLATYMTAGNVGDPSAITLWKWWNNSTAGTMTITSIKLKANVVTASNPHETILTSSMFIGGCENHIGESVGQGTTIYGNGSVLADQYVDLSAYDEIRIYGTPNKTIRLLFNWTSANQKEISGEGVKLNSEGYYSFNLKSLAAQQLNAFKFPYDGQTGTITKVILYKASIPADYSYLISGSGAFASSAITALDDANATSIDATGITAATALPTANPNCLIVANDGMVTNTNNVIVSGTCANLVLTDGYPDGYPFKAPADFTATSASYTTTINTDAQVGTLCLPFAATIPGEVTAWTLTYTSGDKATATPVETTIPANTPVLLNGSGSKTFSGSGAVSASATNVSGALTGVFAATEVLADNYVLQKQGEKIGFFKLNAAKTINPFRAYLTAETSAPGLSIIFPEDSDVTGISEIEKMRNAANVTIFDLQGRKVAQPQKGLYIVNGKKVIFK